MGTSGQEETSKIELSQALQKNLEFCLFLRYSKEMMKVVGKS